MRLARASEVRKWAAQNGMPTKTRGALPAHIVYRFNVQHSPHVMYMSVAKMVELLTREPPEDHNSSGGSPEPNHPH